MPVFLDFKISLDIRTFSIRTTGTNASLPSVSGKAMTTRQTTKIYLNWTLGTLMISLIFHFVNFNINDWNMLSFTTDGERIGYSAIFLFCGLTAILNLVIFLFNMRGLRNQTVLSLIILSIPLLTFPVNLFDPDYLWLAQLPYALTTALTYEFINRNITKTSIQIILQEIVYFIFASVSFFVISDMFAPSGMCNNCGIETRQGIILLIFLTLLVGHIFLLFKRRIFRPSH
jgi:hypothetical protein